MVDTIKFSEMPNAGNINNNDIMPSLRSGENVVLNNPWTFLPPGSTAQRPTPSSTVNYRLRFNTDDQLYEYYDAILGMWTQLQESAFTQGPFITYTADASLPDAQNLGALANGILKQTITTGVATLNIAVNGTDYYGPGFVIPATDGGTGVNNGARTITLTSPTTGFVLTSDSSGNATWQAVSTSGAVTTINGNTGSVTPTAGAVTINGGSTGLTTTGSGSTLSLGGLLNSTFGGLGVSAPTAHGILVGEGASPVTPIVLGAGQILIGTTAGDPVAAAISSGTGILVGNASGSITISLAPIATLNILSNITGGSASPIANTLTATIDAAIGSTQGNVLYRNASGWVVLAPGTSGQFLTTGGAAANVSWTSQVAPTSAALTKSDDTNVTLTLGGSPTIALLAATSLTLGWTGQLSIARGGTSVSSVTTSPIATAFAGWDTNKNLSANNFIAGYTTTATAAGNTTLTVASTSSQFFTGSTTQTVTLPVASTLTIGHHFYVVNNSSGSVTINSSGGNAIQIMAAGTTCNLTCILNSGTSAASWYAEYAFQSGSSTGTVNSGTINQIAWYAATGTAVSGLATVNNGTLTTSATGVPTWLTQVAITKIAVQRITPTGAFSYVPTTGTQYAIFELQGAGSGSAGCAGGASQGSVGAGGGGGAWLKILVAGTTNLAAITGVVGAGGAGGAAGVNNGVAGGSTTLTINAGTVWTAGGGAVSGAQGASATPTKNGGTAGGSVGLGTNATLIDYMNGGPAAIGIVGNAAAVAAAFGSNGGSSKMAPISVPSTLGQVATAGVYPGGGGSGATNGTGGNLAGAAGADGIVIVTEFISI